MQPGKLFVPTDEERKQVLEWAGIGITHDDMAAMMRDDGIDPDTLLKHFKKELRRGRAIAHSKVGGSLFIRALTDDGPAAAIFYAKTRMGWKETHVQEVKQEGAFNMNMLYPKRDDTSDT